MKLVWIASLLDAVVCRPKVRSFEDSPDLYTVLGVTRGADSEAIKAAFHHKSLQYHPDTCSLGLEGCNSKFIEATEAYETLKDKNQRREYDAEAETRFLETKRDPVTKKLYLKNAEKYFRELYGRDPVGGVRLSMHWSGPKLLEGEEGAQENIFGDTDVIELSRSTIRLVHKRKEPWSILFYKPNIESSTAVAAEYSRFAKTFHSFLKVASVNCLQESDFCSSSSVDSFPALRWFDEMQNDPEVYTGDFTRLGKWASGMMKDYTSILHEKTDA